MRIRTRLATGYLVLTLMVAAMAAVGIRALRVIGRSFQGVADETLPVLDALQDLRFSGLRVVSSTNEASLILLQGGVGEEEGRHAREDTLIAEGRAEYEDALRRFADLAERVAPNERPHVATIRGAGERLLVESAELVALAERRAPARAVLEKREEFERAETEYLRVVNRALELHTLEFDQRRAGVEETIGGAAGTMGTVGAIAVVLGLVVGALVSRSITRPLGSLIGTSRQLAAGRLEARTAVVSADELGELARAFDSMANALASSFAAVRRSEADHRELVDRAPLGILRLGRDGAIVAANQALADMLRCESANDVVRTGWEGVFKRPVEAAVTLARFGGAEPARDVECAWERRDGTVFTVRLHGRALHDEAGVPAGVELIAEDVTERRSLEEQLRQAQKMEAIGQLSGGIAHDLNNTLTIIQANADLIQSVLPPGASEAHADLLELQAATRRGAEMIRKLLAFSRREMLSLRPVGLGALVREFSTTLRRLLPESIAIAVEAEHGLPVVRADPGAVEQILMNLVTNARDAMPHGGAIRIAVNRKPVDAAILAYHGLDGAGEHACISVTDTGVGMDERTRSRLFEPFFTTKPQGQGSGLGMAMVYGLARQHDGFVNVYSEPGRGTTVRVYFPIGNVGEAEAPAPEPAALSGGTETILLVEDEEPLRRAARRVLQRFGYTVLEAPDGEEALDIIRAGAADIDLVVSDLVMPKLGGRDLLNALRREGRDVRILFSSGYSVRDVGESQALEPGIPFLHKPWTLVELVTTVRAVLDREQSTLA